MAVVAVVSATESISASGELSAGVSGSAAATGVQDAANTAADAVGAAANLAADVVEADAALKVSAAKRLVSLSG